MILKNSKYIDYLYITNTIKSSDYVVLYDLQVLRNNGNINKTIKISILKKIFNNELLNLILNNNLSFYGTNCLWKFQSFVKDLEKFELVILKKRVYAHSNELKNKLANIKKCNIKFIVNSTSVLTVLKKNINLRKEQLITIFNMINNYKYGQFK